MHLYEKSKSKIFFVGCDQGSKEISELKALIKKLLIEVENLKNSSYKRQKIKVMILL